MKKPTAAQLTAALMHLEKAMEIIQVDPLGSYVMPFCNLQNKLRVDIKKAHNRERISNTKTIHKHGK